MTEQELIDFIKTRAQERWAEQQPYFLSLVATELRKDGKDYRTALGEERLKSFVGRTAGDNTFQVVEHPSQRAKVGILPPGADFHFDDSSADEIVALTDEARPARRMHGEEAVIGFIRSLSRLPDAMLDEIVIPTKVFVKLLSRK